LSLTKQNIMEALTHSDLSTKLGDHLISEAMLTEIEMEDQNLSIGITYGFPVKSKIEDIKNTVKNYLCSKLALKNIDIKLKSEIASSEVAGNEANIPGIKNIIAVASGKGGVGKSTSAVNIALALSHEGANVGILDADIYGPSLPSMLGADGVPDSPDGKHISPIIGHNLQISSIGFLIKKDDAMVWRGPMVTKALEQLLRSTLWENLDYLIIDMPPGTGDIHLSLAQKVPLTGAVIITTPQEIAVLDARKGLKMFSKVKVPILGIVENMATYVCPTCSNVEDVFGSGGAESLCSEFGVSHLGSLPLNRTIRIDCDKGLPSVVSEPDSAISLEYRRVADKISLGIANMNKNRKSKFPKIVVQRL